MSVSAIFGSSLGIKKHGSSISGLALFSPPSPSLLGVMKNGAVIECSSRPQKKATAHHMKTRPKKTAPWDVKGRPTVYPPLPPLPSEWTLVTSSETTAPPPPPPNNED